MNDPVGWPSERMAFWADEQWWQQLIDGAIADPDPASANARITLIHKELSLAMTQVIGVEAGPTYHAWAVWASLRAGRTIRKEDARWTLMVAPIVGFAATATAGFGVPGVQQGFSKRRRTLVFGTGLVGAFIGWRTANRTLSRTSAAILAGNKTVIDDLGRQSARFVCAFAREEDRTPEGLEAFLSQLSTQPSSQGGQSLLRDAYRQFFNAAGERDSDRRDEAMLLGSMSALVHEHWRLQPRIADSIPWPLGRLVTARALTFQVGEEVHNVGRDVAQPLGRPLFPKTLATIESPDLRAFLATWDRTPHDTRGSAATDWNDIGDRINFIVDLFRTRHHDPNLLRPPFTAAEQARILALGLHPASTL